MSCSAVVCRAALTACFFTLLGTGRAGALELRIGGQTRRIRSAFVTVGSHQLTLERLFHGKTQLEPSHEEAAIAAVARDIGAPMARVLRQVDRAAVGHGNGGPVGDILDAAIAAGQTPPPIYEATRRTMHGIGGVLAEALLSLLPAHTAFEIHETELLIPRALGTPVKPIGEFLSQGDAEARTAAYGWIYARVSNANQQTPFRRVVYSPLAERVLNLDTAKAFLDSGKLPIIGGGGGIPMQERQGPAVGEAGYAPADEVVLDKDRSGAMLADALGFELLVILTNVVMVDANWDRPRAAPHLLGELTLQQAQRYYGRFKAGSMGPKYDAAVDYVRANVRDPLTTGGRRVAIITTPAQLDAALRGESGTRIYAP